MTSAARALAVMVCAGLVLAACSSGGGGTPAADKHHPTTTSTASAHRTTSTTSSTTTSTTSTSMPSGTKTTPSNTLPISPTTTTPASASATACNHLTGSASQMMGAAGTITGIVTLTNTGPTTCSMNGYPTLALYSGSGAPLTVTIVDGLNVSLSASANGAPTMVVVGPAGQAQFAYEYSDVPTGSQTLCPSSEIASATAPGATTATPNFQLAADPCDNGTVRVSPTYPPP